MRWADIEERVTQLQMRVWHDQNKEWPEGLPSEKSLLDPGVIAQFLGLSIRFEETLGRFGSGQGRYEVAGSLSRPDKIICLSRQFGNESVRFTAAHEIAHYILHQQEVMHRDRPVYGLDNTHRKSVIEQEADYFAACLLVPRGALIPLFQRCFCTTIPFVFDDNAAFNLRGDDPESLLRAPIDSLDRPMVLATARSYAGRHFDSLAKVFGVSPVTMAIRIKELNLIKC